MTQETFVKAYQAIGQYHPDRSFSTWLFTIARHGFIDLRRRTARMSPEPIPLQVDHDDPGELMAREDDRVRLWQLARQVLPELQFQALWLRYVEEMDVGSIARVLRKTKTHIKVLLFRARQVLNRELQNPEPLEKPLPPARAAVLPLALMGQKGKL